MAVAAGDYELIVVGNDECGEWKCHNQADEAEQGSPNRERQEHNGRIKPHGFTHYLGREEEVLRGLHHNIHQ